MSCTRRLLAVLLIAIATTTAFAADGTKYVTASAVEPAVGRYLVTLSDLAIDESPDTVATQLAAQYGVRVQPFAAEGFRGFMIVATPSRARLLSNDPRVARVQEQQQASAPAVAPVVAAAPAPRIHAPIITHSGGATLHVGTYHYDGAGNIKAIARSAESETYLYDTVSRVRKGSYGLERWQAYDYDRYGNITRISHPNGTLDRTLAVDPQTNQLDLDPASYDVSGTHDAAGNLRSIRWNAVGLEATFSYDPQNVVAESTVSGVHRTYIYDANGERIATIDSTGQQRWTLRGRGHEVVRRLTRNGSAVTWEQDYVYRGDKMLAAHVAGPEKLVHFHLDHLSTPRLVTGNGGAKLAEHRYYPFGEEFTAGDQDGELKKFTGHERDIAGAGAADNLDYMHARYYWVSAGRFLSIDPVLASAAVNRSQSWNRYTYVEDNPVNRVDLDGQIGGIIGKIIKLLIKGGDVAATVAGAVEDVNTITSATTTATQKAGAAVSLASEIVSPVSIRDGKNLYKGAKSAYHNSRRQALREAKRANNVPVGAEPRVIRPGTPEGDALGLRPGENVRMYEYKDSNGNTVWIREDAPKTYPDGGTQGPHFNSGQATDTKLKRHDYYPPD